MPLPLLPVPIPPEEVGLFDPNLFVIPLRGGGTVPPAPAVLGRVNADDLALPKDPVDGGTANDIVPSDLGGLFPLKGEEESPEPELILALARSGASMGSP